MSRSFEESVFYQILTFPAPLWGTQRFYPENPRGARSTAEFRGTLAFVRSSFSVSNLSLNELLLYLG